MKDGISPGGPLSLGLEVVVEQKMHLFCVFLYGLEINWFLCICLLQENMKKLHFQLEEVIKENEKLHDEITTTGAVNQKDW